MESNIATNKWWGALIAAIFCMGIFLSPLIPPFQSPDENDHVKRAYMLSQGQILTITPPNQPSGGEINRSLLEFMGNYENLPFFSNRKVASENQLKANNIRWSDQNAFSPTNGISFYFPFIYVPHAIGLTIGKALDLSVSNSYLLSRFTCLVTSCLILAFAFSYWPPSLLTGSLLILPMSLFQFSSASIDGISTALAILCISIFLRINQEKEKTSNSSVSILTISLVIISSCRLQMLPCIAMLFALYFLKRDKRFLISGLIALVLCVLWTAYATMTTVDFRVARDFSTLKILEFYILHPIELFVVFQRTLTSSDLVKSYLTSFIGVLGWLDTSFPKTAYAIFGTLVALIGISCATRNWKKIATPPNIVLLSCSLLSIGVIFLALLITWTDHPAQLIMGVQGRYFLVPALLISYSLSLEPSKNTRILNIFGMVLIAFLFLFSGYQTNKLLAQRYYIQQTQPIDQHQKIVVSPKGAHNEITLKMSSFQKATPSDIRGISILLLPSKTNTHYRGKLTLRTINGEVNEVNFDQNMITKEGWAYFSLPPKPFISGDISFSENPHLRHILTKDANGEEASCLIYEYKDGTRMYTPGCSD